MEDNENLIKDQDHSMRTRMNLIHFKLHLMLIILGMNVLTVIPTIVLSSTVNNILSPAQTAPYMALCGLLMGALSLWCFMDSKFFNPDSYSLYFIFTLYLLLQLGLSALVTLSCSQVILSYSTLSISGFILLCLLEVISNRLEHAWVKLTTVYILAGVMVLLFLLNVNQYLLPSFAVFLGVISYQTHIETDGDFLATWLVKKHGMQEDYGFKDLLGALMLLNVDLVVCPFR